MELAKYLEQVPNERIARFRAIINLLTQHFPDATYSFKYKMPTYELNNHWLAIANQKNYLSIYTCEAKHLTQFKHANPDIKTGKGCINIKNNDQFELTDLISVFASAFDQKAHSDR